MANGHKYLKIVEWTTQQIHLGAFLPGEKFLSEHELAQRFSCSRQTVRRALEILEHRNKIVRVQGSGTFIAEADPAPLSEQKLSMNIGLLFTYMDSYIFPNILKGIGDVLIENGFSLQIHWTNNTVSGEAAALRALMTKSLDGLIIEPTRSALPCANLGLYKAFSEQNTPVVFIDSYYPELQLPHVALDDVAAAHLATSHLITHGHRRIACIMPHTNRQGHLCYLGYTQALTEHNIAVDESLIAWYSREDMDQVLHSAQLLKIFDECTALLCYNDTIALMVMEFLRHNGKRVPEDVSVMGIDDSDIARYTNLSSVAHPAAQLGEAAANLLLTMIRGGEGKSFLFPPKLITRQTVQSVKG